MQTGTWESYKYHLDTSKNVKTSEQSFIKLASPSSSSLQEQGNTEALLPQTVKSNQTTRD